MKSTIELDALIENYQKELVLVHFMKIGSGKAFIMRQMLLEVVHRFKERVELLEIDITKDQDLIQHLSIKEIPSLYVYKEGKLEVIYAGICPKEKINISIEQLLDISNN